MIRKFVICFCPMTHSRPAETADCCPSLSIKSGGERRQLACGLVMRLIPIGAKSTKETGKILQNWNYCIMLLQNKRAP